MWGLPSARWPGCAVCTLRPRDRCDASSLSWELARIVLGSILPRSRRLVGRSACRRLAAMAQWGRMGLAGCGPCLWVVGMAEDLVPRRPRLGPMRFWRVSDLVWLVAEVRAAGDCERGRWGLPLFYARPAFLAGSPRGFCVAPSLRGFVVCVSCLLFDWAG